MLVKTNGIVFKSIKYSETSLILDIYTYERGLKSYIISGIRNKKSKTKAGIMQVSSLVDIVAYDKNTSSLQRIKEIKPSYLYKNVPFDIVRSTLALFIIELCRKSIKEVEQNSTVFEFIESWLKHLDNTTNSLANAAISFMIELTQQIGFAIHNNYSEQNNIFDLRQGVFITSDLQSPSCCNPEESKYLSQLLNVDEFEYHTIKIGKSTRLNLIQDMIKFYQWHIDNFDKLKTLEVIQSIFSS